MRAALSGFVLVWLFSSTLTLGASDRDRLPVSQPRPGSESTVTVDRPSLSSCQASAGAPGFNAAAAFKEVQVFADKCLSCQCHWQWLGAPGESFVSSINWQ
jgi:hypothetical protein